MGLFRYAFLQDREPRIPTSRTHLCTLFGAGAVRTMECSARRHGWSNFVRTAADGTIYHLRITYKDNAVRLSESTIRKMFGL